MNWTDRSPMSVAQTPNGYGLAMFPAHHERIRLEALDHRGRTLCGWCGWHIDGLLVENGPLFHAHLAEAHPEVRPRPWAKVRKAA